MYGLVLTITKSKLIIILFQQLLTFGTIFFIDFFIRKYNWIKSFDFFRFLLLISFNWFFFHSSLYPYSISANLLILSVFLLLIFFQTNKVIPLISSGIIFGILLNFRSDFYYQRFSLRFQFHNRRLGLSIFNSILFTISMRH